MTKIGLTRPSARKNEPITDEQTQILLDYGVAAENIHQSVEAVLTEMLLALEDEAALGQEIYRYLALRNPTSGSVGSTTRRPQTRSRRTRTGNSSNCSISAELVAPRSLHTCVLCYS